MTPPKKMIPFKSKGKKKDSTDGEIIDSGTIDKLSYEVYQRGVIHIFDTKLMFKKDCGVFEDEVDELNLDLKEDEAVKIEGSGDNDHLIIYCKDGDLRFKLEKRGNELINKLKSILKKGRESKTK